MQSKKDLNLKSETLARDIKDFVASFSLAEELRSKSMLVTGATGLIGSMIVRCLLALDSEYGLNIRIVCLVRDAAKVKDLFGNSNVECFTGVDLEKDSLPDMGRMDYIIHCAAPTASSYFVSHPVETYLTTIAGTNSLLSYVQKKGVESMVYISSLEYYGTIDNEKEIFEDDFGRIDPYDVRSSYSLGKRVAESLCHAYFKEYSVPVKVARLTQVFGAGISTSDNRVFAQFAKSALNKQDIVLHTEGKSAKPYCYTTEAVDAIFHILLKGRNGEAYNVANPDTYINIRDFASLIVNEFNPEGKVIIELDSSRGYAPDTLLKLNADKLKSLGWNPEISLRKMMERLIEFLKETNI